MSKNFFIFLIAVLMMTAAKSYALIITHPEKQNMTVSENGIFFTGGISEGENVYINGQKITPELNGAFCTCFPLKIGDNFFEVQKQTEENTETINYAVKRICSQTTKNANQFFPKKAQYYLTTKQNTILRATPVNAGMNRLGYLPAGTKVFVDGKYNEFLRVYLKNGKYGWIINSELKLLVPETAEYCPVQFIDRTEQNCDTETIYTYTLGENTPYSAITDGKKFFLTIYNLNSEGESYTEEFNLTNLPRYSVIMENGVLTLSIKNPPTDKINIIIDAGHGGKELGAVGCLGDREKDLNLKVALCLKEILESKNYNVYLTREDDSFVGLNERVDFGKNNNSTLFISIHLNSVPVSADPNLYFGTTVYYYNPQAKEFAEILSKTVSEGLKTKNNGTVQSSLAVIRPTEYIGVLAELAFMVNPREVDLYKSEDFAENSAESIYKGIEKFLDNYFQN